MSYKFQHKDHLICKGQEHLQGATYQYDKSYPRGAAALSEQGRDTILITRLDIQEETGM